MFSRSGDEKEYVQDRMLKRADDVAALLADRNTFIYICGLKGMEQGVEESFSKICAGKGMDWSALRTELKSQGRYHIETY